MWLEGITAVDMDIAFANNKHFAAVQDHSEEFTQNITYQGGYGTDGPILRRIQAADEDTFTFSTVVLKDGAGKLNDEDFLKTLRDFDVQIRRGQKVKTYRACNWRRIAIRGSQDNCTLDCDISIPGYSR
jgi:hypothetical protein